MGLFRVRLVVVDSSLPDRDVSFNEGTSVRLMMTAGPRICENLTGVFVYRRGQLGVFEENCTWRKTNTGTCEVSCDVPVAKLRYGTSVYVSVFVVPGTSDIRTQYLNLYCARKGLLLCIQKSLILTILFADGSKCLSTG